MAGMLTRAVERWPDEADVLPFRVADLVAEAQRSTDYGIEGASLALDAAVMTPEAKGIGWAFSALGRWYGAGRSLDDVRTIVGGLRRIKADAKRPRPAGRDVGEYRRPEVEPLDPETERKTAELLAELKSKGAARVFGAGSKEPASGSVAKPPPTPAGVACSSIGNPTVDIHPRQGKTAEKQAFEGRTNPVKGLDSG